MVVCESNSSMGKAETEGHWSPLARQTAGTSEYRFSEKHCHKSKQQRSGEWWVKTHMCVHVAVTSAHTHT